MHTCMRVDASSLFIKLLLLACCNAASPLFEAFVKQYEKKYADASELSEHEAIFNRNLAEIERQRIDNPEAVFVINQFSDLPRVHRNGYTGDNSIPITTYDHELSLPQNVTSVDWRKKNAVSKVYDQGQCGCCFAISVTETIESAWFIAKKGPLPSLSWQQLICCDCTTDDVGCNGGDPHLAYEYIVKAGGVESSKAYPFTDGGQVMPWEDRCNTDQKQKGRCKQCKFDKTKVVASITGYKNVTADESSLAAAVASVGPISVCIDSGPWQTYGGGILTKCGRDKDHCVQVVGYDAVHNPPYWIVKNSWGPTWGEKGYIRIKMGDNLCGIADVPTYPLLSNQTNA